MGPRSCRKETGMFRFSRFRIGKSPAAVDRSVHLVALEAARSVPYYRDLFASAGLAASRVDSVGSLARVPITSRRVLAEPPHSRFLHEKAREERLYASHTSGSTGTPATIFLSRLELSYRRWLLFRAIRARFPRCLPLRITDVGQMTAQKMPLLHQRFGPVRLHRVPGNLPLQEQVTQYVSSAPHLLEGYAGCLELLAHELRAHRNYPRPRCVISRGEVLAPAARALLEEVFDCPVANFYNSEEVGNMAWECRDDPGVLHVNTDACVLELLDLEGNVVPPGVEGRVVVTNLYNLTMPFVRYDIGDHATWSNPSRHACSCGANTPTLSSIDGRTDDFIYLPDLRRVSPLVVLTTVLNACADPTPNGARVGQVRQFQVIQETAGTAVVRVVPLQAIPHDLDERVSAEFRKLHPDFRVHTALVQEIPRDASGKLKRIASRVARSA
jgi:phenylacetate-CoA ligase